MHLSTLLLSSLVGYSIAAPATHAIHEKRSAEPFAWKKAARVDGNSIVPVRIGLTQSNLDNGYDHLMDVSHPESDNYGKHWTAQEVHDMFAPTAKTIEAVKAWLVDSGIKSDRVMHYENKGWLAFDASVTDLEKLLHTEYYEHEHADGSLKVGCDRYHLPKTIREHVDYITPGVKLSARMRKRSIEKRSLLEHTVGPIKIPVNFTSSPKAVPLATYDTSNLASCDTDITPACIRALYSIPAATRNIAGHSLGVYATHDTYAQKDINLFFANYATNIPQGTHPILAAVDGAQAPVAQGSSLNGGESDIDLDMTLSLVYPQTVTLYQTDDAPQAGYTGGYLNTFLDAFDGSYCTTKAYGITGNTAGLDASYPDAAAGGYKGKLQCGVYTPTKVITVSYGEAEADLPLAYQMRQCQEWMKLGLQGHSVFFSSGDFGVASYPGDGSASGCQGSDQTIFNPGNPVTCPYITAVGATMLQSGQSVTDAESAMHLTNLGSSPDFSSGGGFSNNFPIPGYQKAAVSNYYSTAKPTYAYWSGTKHVGANGGRYNRLGRGYPDVSANGATFRAFMNGSAYHFYGTSLAAPLWAGITTLLNQERAAKGKGSIGFINPVLYSHSGVLNDITSGNNPGCGTDGFTAVKGWDPVTGLGTPNYPKLLSLFLSLK